jgi:hypothetical protein
MLGRFTGRDRTTSRAYVDLRVIYRSLAGELPCPSSFTFSLQLISAALPCRTVTSPIVAVLDSSLNVTLYTFPRGSISGAEKRLINITGEQLRSQGPIPDPGKYDDASQELKADYRARTAELRTNCT